MTSATCVHHYLASLSFRNCKVDLQLFFKTPIYELVSADSYDTAHPVKNGPIRKTVTRPFQKIFFFCRAFSVNPLKRIKHIENMYILFKKNGGLLLTAAATGLYVATLFLAG